MLNRRSLEFLVTAVALLLSFESPAFDGNREGIQLSFGIGVHGGSVEDYEAGFGTSSGAEGGLATSFKLGIGFTKTFSLYYIRNASWFRLKSGFNDPFIYLAGISGVGASLYFSSAARSPYVMFAAGQGDYGAPFENNATMRETSSFMLGAGYEFLPGHMLEATTLFVEIEQNVDDELQMANSFQLIYNYMLY